MNITDNIVWHDGTVTRARRQQLNGHKGVVVWFTGLSGAGKSTIAHAVEEHLHHMGCRTYVFDGDNVRHGLCSDLGFSDADRHENIRRIGEMARLFLDTGIVTLAAFITPFNENREWLRQRVGPDDFVEVFCDCSVEVCEQRDVKGLYRRARLGEIKGFTGISAPYEPPGNPDIVLRTDQEELQESVNKVLQLLLERGVVGSMGSHHMQDNRRGSD